MKRIVSLFVISVLVLGLMACSSSTPSASTTPSSTPSTSQSSSSSTAATPTPAPTDNTPKSADNDLVVAMQADATHLDPHVSSNGVSNTITNTMYETLLTFNEKSEIIPLLAKSYVVSDDALSYTFTLNEGIKFHDGEPFNAESVVATYQRGVDDSTLTLVRQIANWESVTADSEYVVTIKLKTPNNTFVNKITQFRIVSPKAIKEGGKDWLAKNSAGTGPFVLSERVDGAYTKMVRNENYWQNGPKIDSLTFKVVPEDGARIAMIQTGEADIINPLPAIDVDRLSGDSSIIINNIPSITYRYVTLNTQLTLPDGKQPFADVRVRQALNYAFDSTAYAKVVFNGYALEPTSIFSQAIMYYSPQTPYKKDIEKAKALMKEAGFEDGFTVNIVVDNTTVEMKGAEFVKQQLSEINVNVELLANESTANAAITSAPLEETKVQMWYVNWGSGSYEADGSMRNILHGTKFPPNGYNTAFWNDEKFNTLLDDALLLTDKNEIAAKYAEAQAIAWEECPWIFLGNDNTLNAYKSYVKGLMYKPGGDIVFRTAELEQ